MTHEPTRPIFTAGKPTKADVPPGDCVYGCEGDYHPCGRYPKADAWVEEKVEEHRKRLQAKAPTTYVWDIVSRLAIKKELEEECDYFRTALLAAHAHGEKVGEEVVRRLEQKKKNLVTYNRNEDGTAGRCNPRCHDSGKEEAITDALAIVKEVYQISTPNP